MDVKDNHPFFKKETTASPKVYGTATYIPHKPKLSPPKNPNQPHTIKQTRKNKTIPIAKKKQIPEQ